MGFVGVASHVVQYTSSPSRLPDFISQHLRQELHLIPDGARPAEIYARAMKPLPGKKDGPRVAIVLGGLGVSANLTQQAIEKLPGP